MKPSASLVALGLVAISCAPVACKRHVDDDLRITDDDRRPKKRREHAPDDDLPKPKPAMQGPVILLGDEALTIDGTKIPLEPVVSDFVALFGKAERIDPSGNTIHVYEQKGLLLYESPGSGGRVIELTILYADIPGFPFMPKKMFAGTLVVQGMPMAPKLELDLIQTKLSKNKWESGVDTDIDTFISGHDTFFIANEGTRELVKVAISFPHAI